MPRQEDGLIPIMHILLEKLVESEHTRQTTEDENMSFFVNVNTRRVEAHVFHMLDVELGKRDITSTSTQCGTPSCPKAP